MRLLSFGEILFDVYADSEHLGGAPLNLAAHAALQGADSYLFSAVGNDSLGKKAIDELEKFGVKTEYINVLSNKETGKCIITLNESAIPSYNLLKNVAYDYIPNMDFNKTDTFDVFAFGTLALREENNIKTVANLLTKNNYSEIYTDLNIRAPFYSEKSISFCLKNATIVKISDEELPLVTDVVFSKELNIENAAHSLSKKFTQIKLIIITCGEKGSYAFDCIKKESYFSGAKPAQVVSTVGAGDSFGATFLVQYFKNKGIQESLDAASKISAFVVSKQGAVPIEMSDFLKQIQ